jgi:CxxC motif-containing protein
MENNVTITCIGCPMGCLVTVTMDDNSISKIEGFVCKKGEAYAKDEVTNPTRMVTAVLSVEGSREPLSVKTRQFIPKEKIFDCLDEIYRSKVALPISIGDVIIKNVCNTGVDVVATKHLG